MKSKLGFFGILALFATLGLVFLTGKRFVRNTSPPDANTSSASKENRIGSEKPKGSLLTLKNLISAPIRGVNTEMARVSPECRELEQGLLGIQLDQVEYTGKLERLPNPEGCSPSDPRVAKILRYYSDRCASAFRTIPDRALPKVKWDAKFTECQMALVMARSTLASLARGARPLNEIQDLRELADELVANFGEIFTAMSLSAAEKLRATADRMAEIDPRLLPAVKAGTMAAMLDAVIKKEAREKGNPDGEAPDWAAFERRIADVEELNPQDTDLDAFKRLAKTSGMVPDLVREDSRLRLQKNPGDWREHQVYAWANWRLGRKDEARVAMEKALRLERAQGAGRDPELHANWKIVNQLGAKKEDFRIQMKIGVGLSDLLR